MRCPFCDSRRVTDYIVRKHCRACGKLYSIAVREIIPEHCFKCGKPIIDPTQQIIMGNNKTKHIRCRKVDK